MATEITGARRCVIIAGSPDADAAVIGKAVQRDDYVIAADRGCAAALKAGVVPDLIVGDFDSYSESLPPGAEILRLHPEKDYSDTFHAVSAAWERGFRDFLLLGATGGRLDHTLANLSILEWLAQQGGTGVIRSDTEEIRLLTEGTHPFDGCRGLTFSVFPFGCASVTLTYRGAKYPLTHGTLRHACAMGLSNLFTADSAVITVENGQAVLILNTEI